MTTRGFIFGTSPLGKQTHVLEGYSEQAALRSPSTMPAICSPAVAGRACLRLWDPRTGTQLFSMPSGGYAASVLMTACWRSDIRDSKLGLWEVAAGGEYRTLVRAAAAGQGFYDKPAIRSDGRVLAVGTHDGVGLWDLHERQGAGVPRVARHDLCLV